MDQSAFYAVVSGINFTLLGLWWVAVKDRHDITGHNPTARRMAYVISLQFSVPGTMALLGQVAPDQPELWRWTFAIAALAGAAGVVLLGHTLQEVPHYRVLSYVFWWGVVPIYVLIAVVAVWEGLPETLDLRLTSLEIEGLLLTVMIFLGVQAAWVVAMAPRDESE